MRAPAAPDKSPAIRRRRVARFSLWVLLGFGLSTVLRAATSNSHGYALSTWQRDEGLPQNSVNAITQTPDGYLWLGTFNGLARFDGVRFRVLGPADTPGLTSARIVQVFADRQGTLWVGTEEGQVLSLSGSRVGIHRLPSLTPVFGYARSLLDDRTDALWALSFEGWASRFESGAFRLQATNCVCMARDSGGNIWLGTPTDLRRWNAERPLHPPEPVVTNIQVEALAPARNGGVWVAGNKRLRRFEDDRWGADLGAFAWTNAVVFGIHEDPQGRIWAATYGRGLFRYDPEGTVLNLTRKDGLGSDYARSLYEDREGNLWVGTQGGGLNRLKPALFRVLDRTSGLASDGILATIETSDGSFWVGTNGEGLHRIHRGQVEHFTAEDGLANGHIWALAEDRHGALWVGTWGGGLFKGLHGKFQPVRSDVFNASVVLSLLEDSSGVLWVGAKHDLPQVFSFDGSTFAGVPLPSAKPADVRALAERSGELWVGTDGDGLYCRRQGEWRHYSKRDGLSSDFIWALEVAADGTVWIGTLGGGLNRLRHDRVTRISTQEGLPDNVICHIEDDQAGSLWLSSYKGLVRISLPRIEEFADDRRKTLEFVSYGKSDGLPTLECAGGFQPAGGRASGGELWFSTTAGLVLVNPAHVRTNPVPPSIIIEEVLIDGERQMLPGARAGARQTEPQRLAISVLPGKRRYEIHYTALSFEAPERVRFRHRLEGMEEEWVEAGDQRVAFYGNLPPGEYGFRVLASNRDGVWNCKGASLQMTILPYFWQRPWFIGAAIVIPLGLGAAGLRRYEKTRLQRQFERLEHQHAIERERARIAKDLHDDLGASLTQITLLGELALRQSLPSHEVAGFVSRITDRTRDLARTLDEIVWAVNPKNDSLASLSAYISQFTQEFLRLTSVKCRVDIMDNLPARPMDVQARHHLYLAVKEALNNIAKHSRASEAWLRMNVQDGVLRLSIEDDGVGFDPAISNQSRSGLRNMHNRLVDIGGRLALVSHVGRGTQVNITLPLKP